MPNDHDAEFSEYASARLTRLHRAAYFLCADAHTADDLVQATLVSLYTRWKQARHADNLDGYVHRILVRRYLDTKRSAWSRVLLRDRLPDVAEAPDDAYTRNDQLISALRRLPVGQRAVIVLRYYSDLSVEATADALGCSTGNVKSQCARGLASLRTLLGGEAAPPRRLSQPLEIR